MVLSRAESLEGAAPEILQALCQAGDWPLALLWRGIPEKDYTLSLDACWHASWLSVTEIARALKENKLSSSDFLLPRLIWETGNSLWFSEVEQPSRLPQKPTVAKSGLCEIFGFPIRNGPVLYGVVVFCRQSQQNPESDLQDLLNDIGVKIAQFIDQKRHENQLMRINECLLSFGSNACENINRLTSLCGELLGSTWAMYNRVHDDRICSLAQWRTPQKLVAMQVPRGKIFSEIMAKGLSSPVVIRHLPYTPFSQTDPWVMDCRLQTFMGQAVTLDEQCLGTLCLGFEGDFLPSESDLHIMGIFTGALVVEEKRQRAEQDLQRTYGDMKTILSSLPGAIVVLTEDLWITYANELAYKFFGDQGSTLIGKNLNELFSLSEIRWAQIKEALHCRDRENIRFRQNGEFELNERVYQYRVFSLNRGISGEAHSLVGLTIIDITEDKQLQDQLLQMEKLTGLGMAVSGIAHEVNNPAQAILGTAEVILGEPDLKKIQEHAREIISYVKHIGALVNNFSSYARPSLPNSKCPINLNERLGEAVKMVRRGHPLDHIHVEYDFQPLPDFQGCAVEIDQAFINLIRNAVDAMGKTGYLKLKTRWEDQSLTICISDNGPGIPTRFLGRIFDPFFTTKEPGKGTGLGLNIAHRILTKHGGTISVESEEERGTTFVLRFLLSGHDSAVKEDSHAPK